MNGETVTPETIEQCVDRQMELATPVIEQACVSTCMHDQWTKLNILRNFCS